MDSGVAVLALLFSILLVGESRLNYRIALQKSILFFEGQRSGKLPSSQRLQWRKDSALTDGHEIGVDLVGGYYDAGDNIKFGFPMAFSTTVLAWSVLQFGALMGKEEYHAKEAVRWGTDYLLKVTQIPDMIFVQVAEPYGDHNCWERPEDMDTPRTVYAIDHAHPGSEVAAETAAALAAASIVFRISDPTYSRKLLQRASQVFSFADKFRGSYNDSLGPFVCPFYCDFSGYEDELVWAAAWLHLATKSNFYQEYIVNNIHNLERKKEVNGVLEDTSFSEFGWDDKHAGINILISSELPFVNDATQDKFFSVNADRFVCSILPESPTRTVQYSPGGLLFKLGGSNMQHPTALSFLLVVYARHLLRTQEVVHCGDVVASPAKLIEIAKSQVDYILGHNPLKMSYMVGYGKKFPQRIHHRASSLPSMDAHPEHIECKGGTPYFLSTGPNPNLLIGAVVGGPNITDEYGDSRAFFQESEPTTYINAPLVGLFAYFVHQR